MAANANPDLSTMLSAPGAVPEDPPVVLPVAEVSESTSGVSVKWGDDEGITQPHNNPYSTYFVVRKKNGNEPTFKEFGSLLHCNDGTLTIGDTSYRIQVIHLKQDPATAAGEKRFRFGWFLYC